MAGMIMNLIAHPDDDLLFLAPDLAETIRGGTPTVTVVVTAGQLSGDGATDAQRYASRQAGLRAAYAQIAGLPPTWTGDLLAVGGYLVERYTLAGTQVHLVFLALPDGKLGALYDGTPQLTVLPADNPMGVQAYGYSRSDLVGALSRLLTIYQPTQVRTLDPLPESRYKADHTDHTTVAKLVLDAGPAVPVQHYRGYAISYLPANLAPAMVVDKAEVFDSYRLAGDHAAAPSGWTERMLYRWPRGVAWVGANQDGRAQLFVVRQGALVTWWENTNGGWSGPATLGGAGGPIAPTVAVARNADGRIQVVARRLSDHQVVSVWQTSPNSSWSTSWTALGNHNAGTPAAAQMGCPVVGRYADGRLALVVKNGGGGVSLKTQTTPGGAWGSWVDLHGTDVQDGLAVVAAGGRLEVFAATRTGLLRWYQATPNGAFVLDEGVPAAPPASPPTAVVGADGLVRVVYRASGADVAVSQQAPCGGWMPVVVGPGPGGHGQLAATIDAGVIRLYGRDGSGGVSTCLLDAGGQPGAWAALSGAADVPAVAVDQSGQLLLATATGSQVSVADPAGTWLTLQP